MKLFIKNLFIINSIIILFFVQTSFSQTKQKRKTAKNKSVAVKKQPLTFEKAIQNAQDFINKKDFNNAFTQAKAAIALNSENYLGYYFASVAAFELTNFADAKNFANESLNRLANPITPSLENLPSIAKSDIEKLLSDITNIEKGFEHLALAEKAITEGKSNEAAINFEKAYQFLPNREDIGIRAARIYFFNLDNPNKSVEILKAVLLRTVDNTSESIKVAAEILEKAQKQIAESKAIAEENKRKDYELRLKQYDVETRRKEAEAEQQRQIDADKLRNQQEAKRLEDAKKRREKEESDRRNYIWELEQEVKKLNDKITGYDGLESKIKHHDYWISYHERNNEPVKANEEKKKLKRVEEELRETKAKIFALEIEIRRLKLP